MAIVGEVAFGEALTAAQLHERLPGLPLATLYRHLAILTEAGILAVRETRQKRGATEKTYALGVNPLFPVREVASVPHRLMTVASAAAGMLVRLFARYTEHPSPASSKLAPMCRFYIVYTTDGEYRALTKGINRLVLDAREAGARSRRHRRRRVLCVAAVPESEWKS
jgi:DNA-binding transcriptional ArsR family regulator